MKQYLAWLFIVSLALAAGNVACGGPEPLTAHRDGGGLSSGHGGSIGVGGTGGVFSNGGSGGPGQGGTGGVVDAGGGRGGAGGAAGSGGRGGTGGVVDAGSGGRGGTGGVVDAGSGGRGGTGGVVDAGSGGRGGTGGVADAGSGGRGGTGGMGMGGAGGVTGDAGNCIDAIKAMSYSFSPAPPCSACKDNQVMLETKCTMMIDCLEPKWPCTFGASCWTSCLNQVGGSGVLDGCVHALTTAACGM